VSTELDRIWSQVQAQLTHAVEEPVYRIWLEPLRAVDLTGHNLTLEAPTQTCTWVRERFGRVLQTCAAAVIGPEVALDVVESGCSAPRRRAPACALPTAIHTATTHPRPSVGQNPKLTFDQFVIGDSNRLAHAAALAVSELPSQAYNPLFVCGPPGVGKTHLLSSIASFIAIHNPTLQLRATTGESFTNDFLSALTSSKLDTFKAGFRHVDVLLIDDVQFLERKTKTEEEFFHTFNALYDAGSQIVLTSDRPPSDLRALEDRLRERFQSGLVADIRPPDLPTRLAILRKRAQHDGIDPVDSGALDTIAKRVSHNVRALEGALIRAVAYSSLTGRPLDAELATEVLDGLYPQSQPAGRSIAEIQAAACDQFGVSSAELVSRTRATRVAQPRQAAMYLARELTRESLPTIARQFGGRDHTTVLHACRRTQQRMTADSAYRDAIESLRAKLQSSS
jgi:chromosomal replication initiator protein